MILLLKLKKKSLSLFNPLVALLLLNLSALFALAEEPILTIQTATEKKVFSLTNLLQRSDLENLIVKNDPAYPDLQRTYKALKVTTLFADLKIAEDAIILFKALDGFSAPLPTQRLLNKSEKASIAYLALESVDDKWPLLKSGNTSAGPFYLIWKNPELSQIGREEWPYMLASFIVQDSLNNVYPNIFPDGKQSKTSSVYKGFNVFVKNCFACHTINNNGSSQIGPDLNIPMNPVEYFKESALKKLIRNPKDLRNWSNSKMPGFSKDVLNDQDLIFVISYLKHMSKRKF